MIGQAIRFLILLLLAPAVWVLSEEAGLFLTANLPRSLSNWAVYGFGVYVLLYPFILGNMMRFFEILEHELTHAIFAFLCLKGVHKLEVDPPAGYGEVTLDPQRGGNTLIYLAPYCVPLLPALTLLVKWLGFPDAHGGLDLLIGVGLGFHLAGLVRELTVRQPDIWRAGPLVAMPVILFANLLLIVVALGVVLNDYAALESYFSTSFARIPTAYNDAIWMLSQGLRWTADLK